MQNCNFFQSRKSWLKWATTCHKVVHRNLYGGKKCHKVVHEIFVAGKCAIKSTPQNFWYTTAKQRIIFIRKQLISQKELSLKNDLGSAGWKLRLSISHLTRCLARDPQKSPSYLICKKIKIPKLGIPSVPTSWWKDKRMLSPVFILTSRDEKMLISISTRWNDAKINFSTSRDEKMLGF